MIFKFLALAFKGNFAPRSFGASLKVCTINFNNQVKLTPKIRQMPLSDTRSIRAFEIKALVL
jgi:hypothetical protein